MPNIHRSKYFPPVHAQDALFRLAKEARACEFVLKKMEEFGFQLAPSL